MKKINYLLFSLMCLFCFSTVFAADKVVIKSITPVYDTESSIVTSEENGIQNVTFNDKNQSIEYKVVIENTTEENLTVSDIKLAIPTEEFLGYSVEGISKDEILEGKDSKEVVISLETIEKEGWGRNFNDAIITTISFDGNVGNPNTSDSVYFVIILAGLTSISLILLKKKKLASYIILTIAFSSILPITKAEEKIELELKVNAKFESLNIMEKAGEWSTTNPGQFVPVDYWQYADKIKNYYIANEFSEITDYEYKFDVSEKKNNRVIAYLVTNKGDANFYDLYLQADGIIYPNTYANNYFYNMTNLDSINNLEGFDTRNVIDMSFMFNNAGYNSQTFKLDLGEEFDTRNVMNMYGMFASTGKNSPVFTLDLGENFDTSKVQEMSVMFLETGLSSTEMTLDLGELFNTGNVTNMFYMFGYTGYSSPVFTLDLGENFDTSKVTNMGHMFNATGYNSKEMKLDLGDKFNTENVTNMNNMFGYAAYSSPVFTLDLGENFDTSKVTDMSYMFNATGYSSEEMTLDLGDKFNTENVTNMLGMFAAAGYSSPTFTLNLGENFDTSKVTNMGYMFNNLGYNSRILTLDLGDKFNTENVTNMFGMFASAGYKSTSLTLDIGDKFDTSKATDMSYMFYEFGYNSSKLNFAITISNPNITDYLSIFVYAARKSGSQITVNYTSETSDIVGSRSSYAFGTTMLGANATYSNAIRGTQVA